MDFITKTKLQLIEDILKILHNDEQVQNLILESEQSVSYSVVFNGIEWGQRLYISWNDKLDFEVKCKTRTGLHMMHFGTSLWFNVRDLIRTRFLDAEKLKRVTHGME
jgi:hypothetical protein